MCVKKKLSEKNGVSILFALLLLLVVAMVSVVMISASVSAVKRTHAKKVVLQKSVSLDSASLLLKNQIAECQPESGFTLTYNDAEAEYVMTETDKLNNSAFKSEITDISQKFANGLSSQQFESVADFKIITTRSGDSKDDVVNVACSIQQVLNNTGEVTFTFTDGDEVLHTTYSLTMSGTSSVSVKWLWKEASTKDKNVGVTNG